MTTNQLKTIIRRKILEATTDVIPDSILLIYTNEAYKDVWKRLFTATDIDTTTITLTAGVGTLPSTFGTAYGEAVGNDGNLYTEVSINDFVKETIPYAYTIEDGEIKCSDTTVANLTMKYWPKPDELVSGSTPSINEYFHEPIIYGAMSRAYEDLQDEELSAFYKNKFSTELGERLAAQSVYEETNQKGAVMFTHQNLIT